MKKLFLFIPIFLLAIFIVSANPVIDAISDKSVAEGSALTFNVTSSAPDNGSTTFWYNYTGVYGSLTKVNNTLATFSWTPGYTDAGVYNFRFNASDDNSSSSATMIITVTNTNRAPTITSSAVTSVVVNHAYSYDVDATDADGDNITYSLVSPPTGMTVNSSTGLIAWTPTSQGNNSVKVKATDDYGAFYMQNFTVAVLPPTYTMTLSDITIGSSTQERDENDTATLTVTNTGTEIIYNITFSENAGSTYNVGFSPTIISSLAAGASTTVTVEAYIPEEQDAGTEKVGTITATGTSNSNQVTGTSDLYVHAENNLVIKDATIYVDDDDANLDDGDDVDVRPGSEIKLELKLKNTHSNIDIEDIEITVEDEDGDLDIDEEESISRIRDGKKETVTIEFTVDDTADEGSYDVIITIEGEDENGAKHGETWTIDFDVNRKTHEIRISRATLESLFCGQDSVELTIELENTGKRDEDEVALEIKSTALNYHKTFYNLEEIEEDDDLTKAYIIPVPSTITSGTKVIDITSYYDNDEESDTKSVYLTVPSDCGEQPVEDNQTGIVVVPPPAEDVGETQFVSSATGEEVREGFFGGGVLVTVLLVLANILVVVIIVILVMKFLIKV